MSCLVISGPGEGWSGRCAGGGRRGEGLGRDLARGGGEGACSFVACLSHLAIDDASLSRRSTSRREGGGGGGVPAHMVERTR